MLDVDDGRCNKCFNCIVMPQMHIDIGKRSPDALALFDSSRIPRALSRTPVALDEPVKLALLALPLGRIVADRVEVERDARLVDLG